MPAVCSPAARNLLLLDNIQKLVLIKRWALTGATVSDAREARR